MKITSEETFSPIESLIRFSTEEEIEKADDIEYGLATHFYKNAYFRMCRVSEKLEYGHGGVNDYAPFCVQGPFRWRERKWNRGKDGKYGLEDYLETELVSTTLIESY